MALFVAHNRRFIVQTAKRTWVRDRIGGQVWSVAGLIRRNIAQPRRGVIDQPRATPWELVTPLRVSPERVE